MQLMLRVLKKKTFILACLTIFCLCFFLLGNLQYMCLRNAALNISCTIRGEYIKSLLRQDAAWFDQQKAGTLTAQLNENINKIRDGIGDKVGLIVRNMTMFLTGIIVGFIYNWRVTLVMFGLGPVSAALLSFMARVRLLIEIQ
ncbi:unnamed protein product [Gongylonema pulchrum]|uniref:ABC transmembrane type-1 domain-containing protein n=1 Tax=Gongylonema pulchrum TaxID=637853 RepID=A0A183D132_9BILA|nr:unnamed protein product [Gongylonema pulchrum]